MTKWSRTLNHLYLFIDAIYIKHTKKRGGQPSFLTKFKVFGYQMKRFFQAFDIASQSDH